MAHSKEIRNKIKSVQSTRKITKAMQMVAASKMRKAQERMRASRPYVERTLQIAIHIAQANSEYKHPFLSKREQVKRVGAIVVTTDKGLCGGLNTNILRLMLNRHKEWKAAGLDVEYIALGGRGLGFLQRMGANIVASVVQLGDRPHLERVVGPLKVLFDRYIEGQVDEIYVFYTAFINTMRQEPRGGRIVPVPMQYVAPSGETRRPEAKGGSWDYIYEPDAQTLLDGMMRRYIEAVDLPDGRREHGLGAIRADGGDEGGDRQRGQDHQRAAAHLQQDATGGDHQGTLGNRRRRGGRMSFRPFIANRRRRGGGLARNPKAFRQTPLGLES